MKILVNGSGVRVGGGVTVLMNFLKVVSAYESDHAHTYHVLVPAGVGYDQYEGEVVTIETLAEKMNNPLRRLYLDHTFLRKRIAGISPDVVFTVGHMAVPTPLPQGILFMYPYAIYPKDKKVWEILSPIHRLDLRARNLIFKQRLKFATVVFPQTYTSKKRLQLYYGNRIQKLRVVPTAYSKIGDGLVVKPHFDRKKEKIYLLCLTKYYKHKNLEILLAVAEMLRSTGSNLKIVTTVEGDQGAGSQEFIDAISSYQLEDILINIGKVPFKEVPALYKQVDGLLLPTLLESFSATYADSLMLKVPIFTSDRDFAKDVCGDAAYYFDPLNAKSIFEVVTCAFQHQDEMKKKIEIGYERALNFPSWNTVATMFITELESIYEKS